MLSSRISALLVASVAACAPQYEMKNSFDPAEAAFATKPGRTTVTGQAFLRQRGGGVVTCAGEGVALMPSIKYTDEMIQRSFGSTTGGLAGAFAPYPAKDAVPQLEKVTKKAQCDANGNFSFPNVAPGAYWAMSKVTWTVGNNIIPEGGIVARRVIVPPTGSVSVLLTQ